MVNATVLQEAVASEPKLFVGQVPVACSEQLLSELMQQFASADETVSVTIPRRVNPPQTCNFAIVTFLKWKSAEAASEALNGSTTLGGKPLVVRFADPPKGDDSKGIVPKKLFVGQIPKDCSESQVRSWFEPHGCIVSLVVKRNAVAGAECALAALHGTKPVESAVNPLVVKFADGKGKGDSTLEVGLKRGSDIVAAGLNKRANLSMGQLAGAAGMHGGGVSVPGGMIPGGYGNPHAYRMMGMGMGMAGTMQGRMWGQGGSGQSDGMLGCGPGQMGRPHVAAGMGRLGDRSMSPSMGAGVSPEMAMNMGGMHAGEMGGVTGMGVGMGGLQMNGMYQDDGGFEGMQMGGGHTGMATASVNSGGVLPGGTAPRNCPWKLFVGQLPFSAGEEDLMALFGSFGYVLECKVLRKSGSQESKGCGFVTFAAADQAEAAMRALNDQAAIPGHSRRIIVHYAK